MASSARSREKAEAQEPRDGHEDDHDNKQEFCSGFAPLSGMEWTPRLTQEIQNGVLRADVGSMLHVLPMPVVSLFGGNAPGHFKAPKSP
jgi:hypothetical protein